MKAIQIFDGYGAFTKYNMEVAFLAGKQSVYTIDTSKERVDEMQKHRHDAAPPPRKPLTYPQIHELDWPEDVSFEDILLFVRAVEAKIKERNT